MQSIKRPIRATVHSWRHIAAAATAAVSATTAIAAANATTAVAAANAATVAAAGAAGTDADVRLSDGGRSGAQF